MERDNRKMMEEEKWTLVIVPKTGFFKLDLGELWRYRDLLVMYIRRDIVTFYKQTILGPLWFILQPLFTVLMFMFVFGGIAGISTDRASPAIVLYGGVAVLELFCRVYESLFGYVQCQSECFRKSVFPAVDCSVVYCGVQFGENGYPVYTVSFIYLYCVLDGDATDVNSYSINEYACLFPLLVLMLAGLGLGFGLLISSLTTKYRDLRILGYFRGAVVDVCHSGHLSSVGDAAKS